MSLIDYGWYHAGDYITKHGDFLSTEHKSRPYNYEIQEVISRLKASAEEWWTETDEIACNVDMWLGAAMSDYNINKLKRRIQRALTLYPFLDRKVQVEIMHRKLSDNSLGIFLKLSGLSSDDIFISVFMDYIDKTVVVMEE